MVISRFTRKSFNITGSESLGIEKADDPDSPYHDHIPIPKILDAQIDQVWMEKMTLLKGKTLSKLSKMMSDSQKRRENWYMIVLTTLVLLYNMEEIYDGQHHQQKRYQTNVRMC